MTDTNSSLGQSAPTASTLTDVITVAASTSEVVSSLMICNQNTYTVHFRISHAVAGAADTTKQYLYYDVPILPKDTFAATVGITLATTDILRCYTDSANVSFNFYGAKVT